jgi:hypothetical protein
MNQWVNFRSCHKQEMMGKREKVEKLAIFSEAREYE